MGDGMGSELNTQSAYHFVGNRIEWCERGYDWGIGRLYSLVTGSVMRFVSLRKADEEQGNIAITRYGSPAAPDDDFYGDDVLLAFGKISQVCGRVVTVLRIPRPAQFLEIHYHA